MSVHARIAQRWRLLLLLIAVAVLSTGCVYLRLLELKKQLSQFEQNFDVQTTDGIAIRCRTPVLLHDDVRWLGASPKKIEPTSDGELWHVRWVKDPPPGLKEAFVYDVDLTTSFTDGRLIEVKIPDRFFAYFSKELFLNLLRSTGTAKVDRNTRSTEAQTAAPAATPLPTLAAIKGMLGEPTRQQIRKEGILYTYRYRIDSPEGENRPISVTFVFDPDTGNLTKLTGKLPRGTLKYDFGGPKAAAETSESSDPEI